MELGPENHGFLWQAVNGLLLALTDPPLPLPLLKENQHSLPKKGIKKLNSQAVATHVEAAAAAVVVDLKSTKKTSIIR